MALIALLVACAQEPAPPYTYVSPDDVWRHGWMLDLSGVMNVEECIGQNRDLYASMKRPTYEVTMACHNADGRGWFEHELGRRMLDAELRAVVVDKGEPCPANATPVEGLNAELELAAVCVCTAPMVADSGHTRCVYLW